ncbi:UNVERIFIED_CONTAM: putative mitochondrial protein [Sesamum radiatum]|uniref:Mitochondrial protein n=1 Tax=Sesamum radiatum TaxID=300843 RepID=A0AAW2TG03_SESRA
MSLLVWNCQGLWGPWTVRTLGRLLRENNPSLVFLAETKCSLRCIESLKRQFDMNGFGVPSIGKSGGLAVLWVKSTNIQLQNYSQNHIDLTVELEEGQPGWRFTGIYGEPDVNRRVITWQLLSRLRALSCRAWLCAGDFNEILDNSEKLGGPPRPNWQMRNFRQSLSVCELHDIGFTGDPFTWSNRQLSPHTVLERFDRACANLNWSHQFQEASVSRLQQTCSDHAALLISLLDRPNSEGDWVDSEEGIRQCVVSHFRGVYTSGRPNPADIATSTECIRQVVEATMAEELLRPYTADEVSTALSQMAPFKSPGPDGMSPIFFQKFWHIVHREVTRCVLNLLNSFIMPPGMNSTHIVLIPKCKHPEYLTHFRPISLCNVVYKIASKTIANRLKGLLDKIISLAQSAFVPAPLITDNILLAFEFNHFMNSKSKGGQGWMALKLDVNKAYDKVKWSFLEQVMVKLGFPPPFIRLVMLCVSSVSFSFLLGGKSFGSIIPERGLRQGDPLSPYLFLLCTESFSSLLQIAEQEGRLQGMSICRAAPSISHLLFADDTLIFYRASPKSTRAVLDVLDVYHRASGQEINFSKSFVAFSKNTGEHLCSRIVTELTIRRENKMELYLGLPSKVSRSKKALFSTIRDSIWKRISGWNAKLFSQAGREVLIKSALQAIPTYAMGCFRLPVTLLREIQGDIFQASLGSRPSFTWRSLMAGLPLFRAGCRWRVGSGTQIRAWVDPWIQRPRSFRPISLLPPDLANACVSDLIDSVSNDWKVELVNQIFWPCDSALILAIPLSRLGDPDLLIWHYSRDGSFSVRSAYHLATSLEEEPCSSSRTELESSWWRKVWQAQIPNKVKVFVWRACVNTLPTGANLGKRISGFLSVCPFCCEEFEDVSGILSPPSYSILPVCGARSGELAEAWVAREAIQLDVRYGWRRVILEGDCAVLIRKLGSRTEDLSPLGPLVNDILGFSNSFLSCQFSWIPRLGNGVAHFLA